MDWTRFGQGKDKMTLWIGFMGVLKSFFIFSLMRHVKLNQNPFLTDKKLSADDSSSYYGIHTLNDIGCFKQSDWFAN